MTHILEDLHGEGWWLWTGAWQAPRRHVDLGGYVSDRSLWFDSPAALVLSWCNVINSPPVVVVALKRVAMDKPDLSIFVDGHSATALPAHAAFVLRVHDPFAEVALVNVEVGGVERKKSRKQDVLNLL